MTISSKVNRWESQLLAACVNSYGAAGSNAALICSEGLPQKIEVSNQITAGEPETYPIIISAASQESCSSFWRANQEDCEHEQKSVRFSSSTAELHR